MARFLSAGFGRSAAASKLTARVVNWWLQTQSPIPSQGPLDSAVVALKAADVLANTLLMDWMPGHELKAESVLDHSETSTNEIGGAGDVATDILACLACRVGQATLSRHLLTDALDFPLLERRHDAAGDMDVAVLGGRQPHVHQPLSPATNSFVDLSAKPV